MTETASAPTADDPGPAPDFGSLPWFRNPFVVAFIAGVITITWLAFRLRYEPDPPPELGAIEVVDWVDAAGAPADTSLFAPGPTVVAFVGAEGAECGGLRLVSKLRSMFADESVPVSIAVVALDVLDEKAFARVQTTLGGPRPDTPIVGPSTDAGADALVASLSAAWPAYEAWREANPRPRASVELEAPPICDGPDTLEFVGLVDDDARFRGFFPVWGWDVESEVFHRAQHVLEAD